MIRKIFKSPFDWHVSSYLHHRRVVWDVQAHEIKVLNDILMAVFRERLNEGFQVVYSATGGPITLFYELKFESQGRHGNDKEDMCLMQIVMFPPVPGSGDSDIANQQASSVVTVVSVISNPVLGQQRESPSVKR